MAKHNQNPSDYIVPLDMNGLVGRMLHIPDSGNKNIEILFVYGQHSSIERWWGLIKFLNHFGAVTVPDLPGFGGMQSFYKINSKPTIDNYADYLASFMKMRYHRKKVVIIGLSFGFVIITRMLQRYPELTKKVKMLISIVGFSHRDDFGFKKSRYHFYRVLTKIVSFQLPALFFRYVCLNSKLLKLVYDRTYLAKSKFNGKDSAKDHALKMNVETWLWHHNDVRTHAFTTYEFLDLDNCRVRVNLPLWHIFADEDQYFNHRCVEQHLKVIFKRVRITESKIVNHAPSIIAGENEAAALVSPELRRAFRKL
jgi:pimeloyl-ACP methyl ester carboxylesterase